MTQAKDAGERFAALMDLLASDAEAAPDEDVLNDAAAAGIDAAVEGERVRTVLLGALSRAKKARLAKAQAAHAEAAKALQMRPVRLPDTPAAQREMLTRFLSRAPHMREAVVTLQHRDFESFSDSDVESALRQLGALGLLDDDTERKP
jgi:hypothetical protein